MKTLLIGGSGQDAFYLSKHLCQASTEVVWIYRGSINRFRSHLDSHAEYINVKTYDYSVLSSLFERKSFDAVVLIAGAVGNQVARAEPLKTYSTNITILKDLVYILQSLDSPPPLYYFSTSDVDGNKSDSSCVFDVRARVLPSSTYGLSKLHASQYLSHLIKNKIIKATIVYLGMHESFYRSGDYVLSKLKHAISQKLLNETLRPTKIGNLNINLDIGFASDYMKIVASAIILKQSPKEIFVGSGVYTNLHHLFLSTLDEAGLVFDDCFECDDLNISPIFYPLMPISLNMGLLDSDQTLWGHKPLPLDATIINNQLKSLVGHA